MVTVAIVKGNEPISMSRQAFTLINAANMLHADDRVLIKPNCVVPKHPSTGVTTNAQVVEGVIEFVKACGVSQITIAEGGKPRYRAGICDHRPTRGRGQTCRTADQYQRR